MLKRLLIAVFVLSLILAFSGTAFAGVGKGTLEVVKKIDPTNPRLNDVTKAGPQQPAYKKPASALRPIPASDLAAPIPPLDYFCDYQYYYGGFAYYWTIPDAYGDDLFNIRFTSDAGYDCELNIAWLLMYNGSAFQIQGNPDMKVYLWDDDGFGFPGNVLDSVIIPYADILAATTAQGALFYVGADFSAGGWVFSDGAEYHLGWTIIDNSGAGTDALAIISDNGTGPYAGEERASEYYGGAWGSMLNDWGGDYTFVIESERCCTEIPYSDCDSYAAIQNVAYYWRAPHPTYGDEAYSQRFEFNNGGFDTLVSVDVAIYNHFNASGGTNVAGDNDVIISIYEDDGAGLPGALVTSQTLTAGTYVFYPSLQNVPFNMTLPPGTYHVAFSSSAVFGSGDYESTLSSNGTDGVGGSASDWGGGTWVGMLDGWGLDCNFYYVVNYCLDQFSLCYSQNNATGIAYIWRLPDQYGDLAHASKIKAEGQGCQVREVSWLFYQSGSTPASYAGDVEFTVMSDVGGYPGATLATITQNASTFNLYPAWTTVDFTPLNVFSPTDFWIAVRPLAYYGEFGSGADIITMSDAGGGSSNTWAEDYAGAWEYLCEGWGVGCDWNVQAQANLCCIKFSEFACTPGIDDDWNTWNQNYARTSRSSVSLSDSWCDLNLNWSYEHPTAGFSFHGPTVYGDKVVQAGRGVRVFDLATGALLYTYNPGPPLLSTNGNRNIVTIENIAALGQDVMFIAGGDQQAVTALDLATGTQIWSRNIGTVGLGGLFGTVLYMPAVVIKDLDGLGTDVAFWGTLTGNIVAVEAATGALYAGWAVNPVALGKDTYKSGSTDGVNLYFGTRGAASEGDLYAIDAATGAIAWQLSAAGGLQAGTIFGADYTGGDEGFMGGAAVADGIVFANSRATGNHPCDGVFYRINAADGSLVDGFASASNRSLEQGLVVDINRVYVPFTTRWVSAPAGGNSVIAFDRGTGVVGLAFYNQAGSRAYAADIILSCEPGGVDDQLYVFDEDGFLICYNAEDATEIWQRRIDNGGFPSSIGGSGALATDPVTGDPHLLFADYYGQLFDLTKGADRARLRIYSYNPGGSVEFGSLASLILDLGPVLTNTGCLDLVLSSVNINDASNGATNPGFSFGGGETMDRTAAMADKLAMRSNDRLVDDLAVRAEAQTSALKSAAAFPVFINGVTTPYSGQVVAPGEDVNLVVDVIQSAILRGPQTFYLELASNDPDFFLNDPAMLPEINVTLTGGCLIDTTTLEFGVGGANIQWATNTGRLGTGDWDPHGFDIDGDGSSYYQGAYFYGISTYRIATHSQDWSSGGGEADALISMQPDPNWCDNLCKPALQAGVNVGAMWNGSSYAPMTGNVVCRSFLDSVQNTWDYGWDGFGQPFDNDSTMGLYANGKTIGVLDVPELANMTFEVQHYTEMNGRDLPGWRLVHYFDDDLGDDTAAIHQDFSAGYAVNGAKDFAWGSIKIPFGPCDGDPLINVVGLNGNAAFWDWNAYWDEAYNYANLGPGDQTTMDMNDGDAEIHITLAAKDIAANEQFSVGIANFALFNLDNAYTDAGGEIEALAHLVNKWAGFSRGDVDDDGAITLADIIYLAAYVNGAGNGPIPFEHLGDVNNDGAVDGLDVDYMVGYYFYCGACPIGDWMSYMQ